MEASFAELLGTAASTERVDDDVTRRRILDAALAEAAMSGVNRLTVEDVVRRSDLGRMTVYRRFQRRDELVRALILREVQRFLDAVAAGIERAPDPHAGVAEAFVAAVDFMRAHPLGARYAASDPGAVWETAAAEDSAVLSIGRAFIAERIHGDAPGTPSRATLQVADVLARLFLTYVSIPPYEADPDDLRRFAREVITPMIERVAPGR